MRALSIKPYLIRAIYDWCSDNALTPYLGIRVDSQTRVPMEYVKNGEIVINLGVDAIRNLHIGNDEVTCGGRFGGVSHSIAVPIAAVIGIFAKETGEGLAFQGDDFTPILPTGGGDETSSDRPGPPGKPQLRVVK